MPVGHVFNSCQLGTYQLGWPVGSWLSIILVGNVGCSLLVASCLSGMSLIRASWAHTSWVGQSGFGCRVSFMGNVGCSLLVASSPCRGGTHSKQNVHYLVGNVGCSLLVASSPCRGGGRIASKTLDFLWAMLVVVCWLHRRPAEGV